MAQEKTYENKIKRFLDDIGAYHVKYFGCAFSQSGVPDLLVCINGSFVAIEVKGDKGKPSALQLHNLDKIHWSGGYAILAYPDDWDNLKELLGKIAEYDGDKFDFLEIQELYSPFYKRFID